MNIAIIYHDADWDGKLSNEVCLYWLKKLHPNAAIHSYGWDYGRPLPRLQLDTAPVSTSGACADWSDYDQIYIVDLSVDVLMARPELRSKVVWIDHHKSAIEKWDTLQPQVVGEDGACGCGLPRLGGYRIDGVAACRLCWQWFESLDAELSDTMSEPKTSITIDIPDNEVRLLIASLLEQAERSNTLAARCEALAQELMAKRASIQTPPTCEPSSTPSTTITTEPSSPASPSPS